ncbi:NnrS family protein [Pseudomonas turukhanskensis]|uniref:NnrS family protein n=1 Tax=Pseudomonas turukhanskensis TaxID=1806536 RepID=UPI0022F2A5EC|nr:NnrS family protein [Pseudomonas turukhanskensis]
MSITDASKAIRMTLLSNRGFRPLLLAGSVLVLSGFMLWLLVLQQPCGQGPTGVGLAWHRHELIFGFACAIIVGFLLAAVQAWTGRPSLSGVPLAVLVAVWLVARLSWWFAQPLLWLAAVCWCALLALYVYHYGPMLWSRSANGPVG